MGALEAKYRRGLEYFEQGQFQAAANLLMEVWSVAPAFRNATDLLTKAYLYMGMKLYSEERYDEAIRLWERILTIDPGNTKAKRYLSRTREEASRLTGVKDER